MKGGRYGAQIGASGQKIVRKRKAALAYRESFLTQSGPPGGWRRRFEVRTMRELPRPTTEASESVRRAGSQRLFACGTGARLNDFTPWMTSSS